MLFRDGLPRHQPYVLRVARYLLSNQNAPQYLDSFHELVALAETKTDVVALHPALTDFLGMMSMYILNLSCHVFL